MVLTKMVIDEINEMNVKLGSKIALRNTGKANVDSERKPPLQLSESELKLPLEWGKAMTGCLAHRK